MKTKVEQNTRIVVKYWRKLRHVSHTRVEKVEFPEETFEIILN